MRCSSSYFRLLLCVALLVMVLFLSRKFLVFYTSEKVLKYIPGPDMTFSSYDDDTNSNTTRYRANNTSFRQVLSERASEDNLIVLASVDTGYVDMAINLFLTSFKKFHIDNYLFVGSDANVCTVLSENGITCFEYIHDQDGSQASVYTSKAFKRKTHLKTKIILEALMIDLKVLITDVDIVFLKNPIPFLKCGHCDIEISSDVIEGNSGFYLVKPTDAGKKLHLEAWEKGIRNPSVSNQKAIDRTLEKMAKAKTITVKNLDPHVFTNGVVYFEKGKRMFKEDSTKKPCSNCVIVHNNWMLTKEGKEYRFKEMGMYEVDADAYYSNTSAKYLSFGLPKDFGKEKTKNRELDALRTALIIGAILDRVVILPQFHCYGCKEHPNCNKGQTRCTFGAFYRIAEFDSYFRNLYRENAFLEHDLVPSNVRSSQSAIYLMTSAKNETAATDAVKRLVTSEPNKDATVTDIQNWFAEDKSSVLRFRSLYFKLNVTGHDWMNKLKNDLKHCFVPCNYRQFNI